MQDRSREGQGKGSGEGGRGPKVNEAMVRLDHDQGFDKSVSQSVKRRQVIVKEREGITGGSGIRTGGCEVSSCDHPGVTLLQLKAP